MTLKTLLSLSLPATSLGFKEIKKAFQFKVRVHISVILRLFINVRVVKVSCSFSKYTDSCGSDCWKLRSWVMYQGADSYGGCSTRVICLFRKLPSIWHCQPYGDGRKPGVEIAVLCFRIVVSSQVFYLSHILLGSFLFCFVFFKQ